MFIERTALQQTRFRTPGVSPDARGVVIGQRGLVLFSSLDRVVSFFRAYSEDTSLDELIPTLRIQRVTSPLRTKEVVVSFAADSSYRMDRIAGFARLVGADVFTGTSRHYVKYRDAASPLGYDLVELVDLPAAYVLYHEGYRQTYDVERELGFRELVMKLRPIRESAATSLAALVAQHGNGASVAVKSRSETRHASVPSLFVTAEVGIGHALIGYLYRWGVSAKVGLVEWPARSAFDATTTRLHLFVLENVPGRIVALLESLPGVSVFVPVTDRVGVARGTMHPFALDAMSSLFAEGSLTLFRHLEGAGADVETVWSIEPLPPLADVKTMVRTELAMSHAAPATARSVITDTPMRVSFRLAPSLGPFRRVVASRIEPHERAWLAKLLYVLPPRRLESLSVALSDGPLYLLDREGIDGVPLGRFYCEAARRIYVPYGLTLVPTIAPERLEELVVDSQSGHVFFDGQGQPTVVPIDGFVPISRTLLHRVSGALIHIDLPDRVDPPLPVFEYGASTIFPLWSAVGEVGSSGEPALGPGRDDRKR